MKKQIPYILFALTLASCHDDIQTEQMPVPILFGSSQNGGEVEWINGRTETRAGEGIVEAESPQSIGVFAFSTGQNMAYVFKNQKVLYKDSKEYADNPFEWNYKHKIGSTEYDNLWPYTTVEGNSVQRPWDKARYKFFAYSPWAENKDVNVSSESYEDFTTFIWDNIPGFAGEDHVLANEIIQMDNTAGTVKTEDVVVFRMRHILSRIRFFFKMSPEYRKLRKIELNSLTVLSAGKYKSATFNFNNSYVWDGNVHWSNVQLGTANPVILTNRAEQHYFIPTTYPDDPFTSVYVYPQTGFNELKMTLDYTTYDSQDVATRHSSINSVITLPNWSLKAGYYYDIKISIVPDFLYVLSDNDQDFDGYVIFKED